MSSVFTTPYITRGIIFREDFTNTGSWIINGNNLDINLTGSHISTFAFPNYAVRFKNSSTTPSVIFFSGSIALSTISGYNSSYQVYTGSLPSGSIVDRIEISSAGTLASFDSTVFSGSFSFTNISSSTIAFGSNLGDYLVVGIAIQNPSVQVMNVRQIIPGYFSNDLTRQGFSNANDNTSRCELWSGFSLAQNASSTVNLAFVLSASTSFVVTIVQYINVGLIGSVYTTGATGSNVSLLSTAGSLRDFVVVGANTGSSITGITAGTQLSLLTSSNISGFAGQITGSALTVTASGNGTGIPMVGVDLLSGGSISTYSTDGDILTVNYGGPTPGTGSIDFIQIYQENFPLRYVNDRASYSAKARVVSQDAPMREQQIVQRLGSESPMVELDGVFITDTDFTAQNYRDKLINVWQEGNYQWLQTDFIGAKFIIGDYSVDEIPGIINYYKWTMSLKQYTPIGATLQNYNLA